jgi:hypothetical protein
MRLIAAGVVGVALSAALAVFGWPMLQKRLGTKWGRKGRKKRRGSIRLTGKTSGRRRKVAPWRPDVIDFDAYADPADLEDFEHHDEDDVVVEDVDVIEGDDEAVVDEWEAEFDKKFRKVNIHDDDI